MSAAWLQMAILQRKRGDMTAAIDALGRLIALNPEDGGQRGGAGPIPDRRRAGRRGRRAAPARTPRRPTRPLDVLVAQGVALARLGRLSEAATALERARRADPSNAMARVELGTVRLLAGAGRPGPRGLRGGASARPGTGPGPPLARPARGQAGPPGRGPRALARGPGEGSRATWTRCCRWGPRWPGAGRWTRRVRTWSSSWRRAPAPAVRPRGGQRAAWLRAHRRG